VVVLVLVLAVILGMRLNCLRLVLNCHLCTPHSSKFCSFRLLTFNVSCSYMHTIVYK